MKKIAAISAFLLYSITGIAQIQTIQFNSSTLLFDNGRSLPAETSFMVNTDASANVSMIKMQISAAQFKNDNFLFESIWKRKEDEKGLMAVLPNSYKLRGGNDYDFRFIYYRDITEKEHVEIGKMLGTTANSLLRTSIQFDNNRYRFLTSPSDLYRLLNETLQDGMASYASQDDNFQPKFSGIIENILRTMNKVKVHKLEKEEMDNSLFQTLVKQVNNEVKMIANHYQFIAFDKVTISDYPVEKVKRSLALNFGYAGIYNNGGYNDLDYFTSPYAGISLPLGKRAFSNNFWNNTSVSLGIFLKNFKNTNSERITGPVVGRPIYAALGYRIFNYFKINAGAALMQDNNLITNTKAMYVRPFIGLSLEINLWLGFDKK